MLCERCYQPLDHGAHGLFVCPLEPRRAGYAVVGDEIPGGIVIEHGLCNADGTPKRYYSRSELKLAAAVKGVIPYHDVYAEGGNKTLSDARQRDAWLKSGEAQRAKRDRDDARREKALARR